MGINKINNLYNIVSSNIFFGANDVASDISQFRETTKEWTRTEHEGKCLKKGWKPIEMISNINTSGRNQSSSKSRATISQNKALKKKPQDI